MASISEKVESLIRGLETTYHGMAVGAISDGKHWTHFSGYRDVDAGHPMTGDTVFPIGSISKPFTAILLTEMVARKLVGLDDSIGPFLPNGISDENNRVEEITFRDLALHQSSLPRLPKNLVSTMQDPAQPYANYTVDDLLQALKDHRVSSKRKVVYSNFGYALLGYLLGQVHGSDYATALRQMVLQPMGLADTSCDSPDFQCGRVARQYTVKGMPVAGWQIGESIAAAGAVNSTLADMLKFLAANVEHRGPLGSTLLAAQQSQSKAAYVKRPLSIRSLLPFLFGLFILMSAYFFLWPAGSWMLFWASLATYVFGSVSSRVPALLFGGIVVLAIWLATGRADDLATSLVVITVVAMAISPIVGGWQQRTLAWNLREHHSETYRWHNGMVAGAASFMAFCPRKKVGVVVLANTACSVDTIGDQLMDCLLENQ